MDETDIMKHDQLNGARRQKGYDYLKRPVGKEKRHGAKQYIKRTIPLMIEV